MQKNYFISQESSRYSVRKQDWFFLLFVYIKCFRKKIFLYINWNYDDCHHRKTKRTIIYKEQKNCETFLYTKSLTLFRKLDNFCYVFIYKKPYTWSYGIFMKFLKLAFIYKKHDTLRNVKFLYTKIWTLSKKKDNLRFVFIYKNPSLLRYAIFNWIFEICGGGGHLFVKKQCTLREIYISKKQCTLRYIAIKSLTLCVTF